MTKDNLAKRVLIIGATAVLAQETAKLYAKEKASFILIARNPQKLRMVAHDLEACGARQVHSLVLDVNETERYDTILQEALSHYGGIDLALIAHGVTFDQKLCERDPTLVNCEIQTNFTSTIALLFLLANHFEHQQHGTIAVISSVSGDRGRKGQYLYASCKSGLTVFLQGLRQRLYASNVAVVTLKPGLTDTPFTEHLKAQKRSKLFSSPELVAQGMMRAIENQKEEVYLPWFWKYIMLVIKSIPESIFKKINLD